MLKFFSMLFDMERPSGFEPYEVLVNLIVPRPIAWVSTLSPEGVYNLAPFSFFNALCDEPPLVVVSVSRREDGRKKDTAENALKTGDFVINIASEELLEKVKITSKDFPPEVDEFEVAGLTPVRAYKVKSPRLLESRAWLECELFRHEELFGYDLLYGRVVFAGAESLDYRTLKPLGRVGGGFCRIIEINQEP
ncbi:MAG: flavin reductase family protein [Aquificaceae bacterium]|nr:flavin reductase family protein [Aquificaceae bacterium]MDW8032256.1 flavin reductase family protein [Aquificaceae bacterium]